MDENELSEVVTRVVAKKHGSTRINPYDELKRIHRKKFPAAFLPHLNPLFEDSRFYCYAIDIAGNMREPDATVVAAIKEAWENSWEHGVPQASIETFRALLKIGSCERLLLQMIVRSLDVDNYSLHKCCAETLMKLDLVGLELLKSWSGTQAGKCDCRLHQGLTEKINRYLAAFASVE